MCYNSNYNYYASILPSIYVSDPEPLATESINLVINYSKYYIGIFILSIYYF